LQCSTNSLIIGQIAASLTSLSRTLDEYADLAKKELIPAKQEKAQERIKNFRADLLDYRQSFERLRKDREDIVSFPPGPMPHVYLPEALLLNPFSTHSKPL
jgi:hypothetical protein